MVSPYLGIFVMLVLTVGFLVTMLVLSSVLGPKNKTATKQLPFECGSVSIGDVKEQRFHIRFYVVAMLFILFDIEVIFLYPWAVIFKELGWFGFFEMLTFMLVLGVGLIYVWRKGVLDWNEG